MTIIGLHHTNISIPSGTEDEARAFYGDLLGLEEFAKPEALQANGGLWFKLGNTDLHLGIQDGVEFQALRMHEAYQVDDLSALRETLEAAGISIDSSDDPIPGLERFKIRDPFGNLIEFVQAI